jgi:hypothetical protein
MWAAGRRSGTEILNDFKAAEGMTDAATANAATARFTGFC